MRGMTIMPSYDTDRLFFIDQQIDYLYNPFLMLVAKTSGGTQDVSRKSLVVWFSPRYAMFHMFGHFILYTLTMDSSTQQVDTKL